MATLRRLSAYNPYQFYFRAPTPPLDSDFSDQEISTRDIPEIFRPVYHPPPAPPSPPPQPQPREPPSPQKTSSVPAPESTCPPRPSLGKIGGAGDEFLVMKKVLVVLAVLTALWSWMGMQGVNRGVCLLLPGSGGMWDFCLDAAAAGGEERKIGDDMRVYDDLNWDSAEPSSRTRTRPVRKYKYEKKEASGQDFGAIVRDMLMSADDLRGLVKELAEGEVEIVGDLAHLSDMNLNDGFKDLQEELRDTVQASIGALKYHTVNIEELTDGIITYNSLTVQELEKLQNDGPATSLSWSDKVRGWFHTRNKNTIERQTHELLDLFTSKVGSTTENITVAWTEQLEEVGKLKAVFDGIARTFMQGESGEQGLGQMEPWKKALRAYTRKNLDFENMAASFADFWNVMEDAGALVGDNIERLYAFASSLEKLNSSLSTGLLDESDVAGWYAGLLESAGMKLEQARSAGRSMGKK